MVSVKKLTAICPIQFLAMVKTSLKPLVKARFCKITFTLTGQSLYAGMYLNEILQNYCLLKSRLLEIWQHISSVLQTWQRCLSKPAQSPHDMTRLKWHLRRFENVLFEQLGYGFDFAQKDALGI